MSTATMTMTVEEVEGGIKLDPFLRYPIGEFISLRLEFAALCGDLLEALILRVIEYLIEGQRRAWNRYAAAMRLRGKEPRRISKTLWVDVSYQDIIDLLYGLVKDKKTIKAKLAELVRKYFLRRRINPKNPFGDPQYTINQAYLQKCLDALPVSGASEFDEEFDEEYADLGVEFQKNESHGMASEAILSQGGYQKTGGGVPKNGRGGTKDWGRGGPKNGTHLRSNRKEKNDKEKESAPLRSASFSLLSDQINLDAVRTAPWSIQTVLALTSAFLPVPSREAIEESGDPEALRTYMQEWHEPAKLLFSRTCSLSPTLAWERIDLAMRCMGTPGSPSWWQREVNDPRGGRKVKAAITLKNVERHFVNEFDGFRRSSWYPAETTPYDGPPIDFEEFPATAENSPERLDALLDDTAVGSSTEEVPAVLSEPNSGHHSGVTITEILDALPDAPATESVEEQRLPAPVEEPAPSFQELPGMSRTTANHLVKRIMQSHPTITPELFSVVEDGSRVVVGIEYALDAWHYFNGMSEWLRPTPQIAALVDQAAAYGVGMTPQVANDLIDRIVARHPSLVVSWQSVREDGQRLFVGIQFGPDDNDWLDLRSPQDWFRRSEETQSFIEQATWYSEALSNAALNTEIPQTIEEER